MRQLQVIVTLLSVASISPVLAQVSTQVDPKIHKLCLEAKDYAGCVRAMNGDTSSTTRQINSQGADIAEGNQCPSGWAYVGGGNCMEVKCIYPKYLGQGERGHDQRIAGKNWSCGGVGWFTWPGVLRLEGNARASINPDCPKGEPEIGYNSTCQSSLTRVLDSVQ